MTDDEAAILWNISRMNRGLWLEIGSHTGWSTVHIADSNKVMALEPEFGHPIFNKTNEAFMFIRRFLQNVHKAKVEKNVMPFALKSEDFLPRYHGKKFRGVLVDGNHDDPFPKQDAEMILPHLEPSAVVVFHDYIGKPVQNALEWLLTRGFKKRVYRTPQLLGIAYRGNVSLPDHVPDPSFEWNNFLICCGLTPD